MIQIIFDNVQIWKKDRDLNNFYRILIVPPIRSFVLPLPIINCFFLRCSTRSSRRSWPSSCSTRPPSCGAGSSSTSPWEYWDGTCGRTDRTCLLDCHFWRDIRSVFKFCPRLTWQSSGVLHAAVAVLPLPAAQDDAGSHL